MVDNATRPSRDQRRPRIFLEQPAGPERGDGIIATIQGGACRDDYIDVPPNATSLTIDVAVVSATGPVDFSIELCPLNGGTCKSTEVTNAIGGAVTIDQTDLPPLQVGTYTVRTCNLTPTPITVNIRATFGFSLNTVRPILSDTTVAPMPILDNAVTDIYLTNDLHGIISSLDVGLLISDPRVSDLAITLISPNGTRVLLFENRGAVHHQRPRHRHLQSQRGDEYGAGSTRTTSTPRRSACMRRARCSRAGASSATWWMSWTITPASA